MHPHKNLNLEEYNMGMPKRKNNIDVYTSRDTFEGQQVVNRRQELLDRITKSDSFTPDSILHDDLDGGMLDFIKTNFKVVSDGGVIPVIPKILTIQRWGEFSNNWQFSDDDGNVKLPFIAIIRKPDAQPGTHPITQRTIPDRRTFYYASVPTWNGNMLGADVYKIPQPVAVDISFDVTIVCTKFRDLNKFNKIVMQKFSSRQAFTSIKGHYIPIMLDGIEDNSPVDTLDGRRFYMQNYKFIMMGILIDSEEFEVKPAISRAVLINEFITSNRTKVKKTYVDGLVNYVVSNFNGNGSQTLFSVGEGIESLISVSVDGVEKIKGTHFNHIATTSNVTFFTAPQNGSLVSISYQKKDKGIV